VDTRELGARARCACPDVPRKRGVGVANSMLDPEGQYAGECEGVGGRTKVGHRASKRERRKQDAVDHDTSLDLCVRSLNRPKPPRSKLPDLGYDRAEEWVRSEALT
jgi:hypothetical protein